jgi:hypothetical protein
METRVRVEMTRLTVDTENLTIVFFVFLLGPQTQDGLRGEGASQGGGRRTQGAQTLPDQARQGYQVGFPFHISNEAQ